MYETGLVSKETDYSGVTFRSKLEARWAVFFDELGVRWEYEPESFDLSERDWYNYTKDFVGYIPDFWLDDAEMFVEIKGDPSRLDEGHRKAKLLSLMEDFPVCVFFGNPGENLGTAYMRHNGSYRLLENRCCFNKCDFGNGNPIVRLACVGDPTIDWLWVLDMNMVVGEEQLLKVCNYNIANEIVVSRKAVFL